MKPINITYSRDMTGSFARMLLSHKEAIQQYALDHPEEYAKFSEEWDRTHGKEETQCGTTFAPSMPT